MANLLVRGGLPCTQHALPGAVQASFTYEKLIFVSHVMFPKFLGVPVSCRGWISKSGQYRTHLPSSVRNYSCSCSTRPYAPGQVPVDKKGGCDGRIRSSVKRCKRATLDAPSADLAAPNSAFLLLLCLRRSVGGACLPCRRRSL
jgi:hypothetical protein